MPCSRTTISSRGSRDFRNIAVHSPVSPAPMTATSASRRPIRGGSDSRRLPASQKQACSTGRVSRAMAVLKDLSSCGAHRAADILTSEWPALSYRTLRRSLSDAEPATGCIVPPPGLEGAEWLHLVQASLRACRTRRTLSLPDLEDLQENASRDRLGRHQDPESPHHDSGPVDGN